MNYFIIYLDNDIIYIEGGTYMCVHLSWDVVFRKNELIGANEKKET